MKYLIPLVLLMACLARAEPVEPADFAQQFARLAELVDKEQLGALDVARGSYDAARLLAAGAPGLAWVEPRFKGAGTFGEAAVAGLYMTAWGKADHIDAIRRELEENAQKRKWLAELVGSEQAFFAHLDSGSAYQPLLSLLPSIGGSRALAIKCIGSKDALVRRAGLFWGYWLSDPAYWPAVRALAKNEKDRTTLRIAQQLLLKGAG